MSSPLPAIRSIQPKAGLLAERREGFESPSWGSARAPGVPFPVRGVLGGWIDPLQGPPFERLQEVVVMAEQGQVVEGGGSALGEGDDVVDLEPRRRSRTRAPHRWCPGGPGPSAGSG